MSDTLSVHPAHAPHSVAPIQPFPDQLYVVTAISNPVRFHSRYRLYRSFAKHMEDSGVILYTIEAAYGDRPFEVTSPSNPRHIQLRTRDELWHKENLLNLAIARLPAAARYIAWVDADISFTRSDWAQEALQQLQHHQVIQLFSHSVDLDVDECPVDSALGWVESHNRGLRFTGSPAAVGSSSVPSPSKGWVKGAWHSGLAWAARREALDHTGALIDFAILGSADRNMAAGLLGFMADTIDSTFAPSYRDHLLRWQDLAVRHLHRNVGQVTGTVMHHWHGPKRGRGYTSRWRILSQYQFNPLTDIKRDAQGLWQLECDGSPRLIGLRDAIRAYFRARDEDARS